MILNEMNEDMETINTHTHTPPKTRVQVSAGTSLETLRLSEVVETRFVTLQFA